MEIKVVIYLPKRDLLAYRSRRTLKPESENSYKTIAMICFSYRKCIFPSFSRSRRRFDDLAEIRTKETRRAGDFGCSESSTCTYSDPSNFMTQSLPWRQDWVHLSIRVRDLSCKYLERARTGWSWLGMKRSDFLPRESTFAQWLRTRNSLFVQPPHHHHPTYLQSIKTPSYALRPPPMPPDSPPLTRPNRFDPIRTRSDASSTRTNAIPTKDAATRIETNKATMDATQRPENLSMNELWKYIVSNNKLENGDVVVPANLVQIMSALVITMQETTLRLNALESQLQGSRDTSTRIEKLERQLTLMLEDRTPQRAPQPAATNLPAKPKTWAAFAAEGVQIVSTRSAPPPPPSNQAINAFKPSHVVIRTTEGKKPFDGVKATEIVNRVNEALAQLDVRIADRKLMVKGAASLPSGSIKLFTATKAEANWLLENRSMWSTLADPDLITSPAVFPAVIDSIPMEYYSDVDEIKTLLSEQNPIPGDMIHSIRWLSKPHPEQRSGSIIINLLDKELTNRMIRGSVYFEGNSLRVRACKRSRVQCTDVRNLDISVCNAKMICFANTVVTRMTPERARAPKLPAPIV